MNPNEIQEAIYGKDGLYSRVIAEINRIGIRKAGELSGKSTQHINTFRAAFNNEKLSNPKLETISKIAECLGVE